MLDDVHVLAAYAGMELDEQVFVGKLDNFTPAKCFAEIIGNLLSQFGAGRSGIQFDATIDPQFI